MSRYSNINIGDEANIIHKITKEDIERFVELSGDDNKLHIDESFAKNTSFKKPVAHGMLGASFISTIIGTKLPGDGALWFAQSLEFLLPVRVGDELTVTAKVLKKNARQNSIELQTDIFNQYKQKVTAGIAQVKIIEDEVKKVEDKSVHEKVALIVGATGGIGSQTARVLAKDGYHLVLHYHSNQHKAESLKAELEALTDKKILTVRADITNQKNIDDLFFNINRFFGYLTAFINASTLHFGNIKFEAMEWEDINSQIGVNIKSSFALMKGVVPLMEKNKYGKVVFITTQYTEQMQSELLHYITAKSALNGFAKTLAVELAPKGIRVNLVSPGMTDTDLTADLPEKIKLLTTARTPLKRLAETKDVAEAINYLVSDKSNFLTGETIRVNGGQVML
ncbi:MAG: SDR family oxidoreductase [Marinomonas colpomeniae]